jgi:RNA polymerase sigma-70 factor, ECF subfamily
MYVNSIISDDNLIKSININESKIKSQMYKYLFKRKLPYDLIDDALQTARIKAFKSKHKFKIDSNFSFWYGKIVQNALKDQIKEHGKHMHYGLDSLEMHSRQTNVADNAEQKEGIKNIVGMINSLPDILKKPMYDYAVLDKSYKEMSEEMNVAASVLRVRIHRAKKILQKRIKEEQTNV